MSRLTEDLRIRALRPLLPPAILHEEIPETKKAAKLVRESRNLIEAAVAGRERRLVAIVGPCSVHDTAATLDYSERLRAISEAVSDRLIVALRCYFEKPRTTIGWKGLINDPYHDGSFRINEGLRLARRLLADVAESGMAAATEFLDTTVPQHIADLVSWGAIGARTVESQTHRELASGLSMPIGFKNTTEGSIQPAIDALKTVRQKHWFAGSTKDGIAAIVQTAGNPTCHLVLRGGSRTGPNYQEEHVRAAASRLAKESLNARLMVDCSHGNSQKDHLRQVEVAADVGRQLKLGDSPIFGVMIESFLQEGRQDVGRLKRLKYGQSITDACLSIEQTEQVLLRLAEAVR